jgi:hypothetical protein
VSVVTDGQGLNITLVGYLGQLHFGLVSCRELVPDIDVLAGYLVDELGSLAEAAEKRTAAARAAETGAGGLMRSVPQASAKGLQVTVTRDARAVLPEGTAVPGQVPAEIFAAAVDAFVSGSGSTCGPWPGASAWPARRCTGGRATGSGCSTSCSGGGPAGCSMIRCGPASNWPGRRGSSR